MTDDYEIKFRNEYKASNQACSKMLLQHLCDIARNITKTPMKTENLVKIVTGNLINMKQYCYKLT
jgi:hypothetical protein